MAIMEYYVDLDKNFIFSKYAGELKAEELIEHMMKIRSDENFTRGLNALVDLRDASPTKGYLASASVGSYLKSNYFETGKIKAAIVVQKINHEIIGLFLTIIELSKLPYVIEQFTTKEEAEYWLASSEM